MNRPATDSGDGSNQLWAGYKTFLTYIDQREVKKGQYARTVGPDPTAESEQKR
jgi:hypothetical protein